MPRLAVSPRYTEYDAYHELPYSFFRIKVVQKKLFTSLVRRDLYNLAVFRGTEKNHSGQDSSPCIIRFQTPFHFDLFLHGMPTP